MTKLSEEFEGMKLIDELIKDFKREKVTEPQKMPYVSAEQFNRIIDSFIDYLKDIKKQNKLKNGEEK